MKQIVLKTLSIFILSLTLNGTVGALTVLSFESSSESSIGKGKSLLLSESDDLRFRSYVYGFDYSIHIEVWTSQGLLDTF